jgi:hypothetical protein
MQGQVLSQLRDLYRSMDGSEEGVNPAYFLTVLRRLVPQFNEMAQPSKVGFGGRGYAQQGKEISIATSWHYHPYMIQMPMSAGQKL